MATRSTIAIENNDGTVSQVYCHWDGYLEGVGKTLLEHYNTREAVEKLLAGGSISSLGEYVSDDEKSFDKKHDDEDDYTVYYTYRGEDPVIEEFDSLSDYEENHQYEEFEYIFTQDNVWSVFFNGDWHDLELELSEKK
jgi:hypothetical protein